MIEKWKPVKGYEGLYEVSSFGAVRSLDRSVKHKYGLGYRIKNFKGRILKKGSHKGFNKHPRNLVVLCKDGKTKPKYVSQLVAETFLNHVPNGRWGIIVKRVNPDINDDGIGNIKLVPDR